MNLRISSLLLPLLSILMILISLVLSTNSITIANVKNSPNYFIQTKFAKPNEMIQFKILLKQRNLNILENKFWDISNPKSKNYGKFMSADDIDSIIAPLKKDVELVESWLIENGGIHKNEMIIHSDFIQVLTSVKKASNLFNTKFAHYKSIRTKHERIRIIGEATIPFEISLKIDFILGLSDFIEDSIMSETMKQTRQSVTNSNLTITPEVIQSYYGIPNVFMSTNGDNSMSIAAFNDYYDTGSLNYFDGKYGIDGSYVRVTNVGKNCIWTENCDQDESSLDIEYITAIGLNISTLFLSSGNGEWVLDWSLSIQTYNPIPKIASISYGWAELEQCEITSSCPTLGVNSTAYISRTDVEFQKIGLKGCSIFAASGDDGSPSFFGSSGNCPIDGINHFCPLGGCAHTSSQCSEMIIVDSNGTLCFIPMGEGGSNCQELISQQEIQAGVNEFNLANPQCDAHFEVDIMYNFHLYSNCSCDKLNPYVNSEVGFKIVGYSYNQEDGSLFQPMYPASSPYVTSVGATQIYNDGGVTPETVCSIESGAIITSGGGFSLVHPQPSYQASAVQNYLKNHGSTLPPPYSFTPTNRAYPDIVLAGHQYSIAIANNQSNFEQSFIMTTVDGTSCSSPTVAGMFATINEYLLNNNKPALGFLNPLLYQAAQEQPNVFNDITTGNNNCNRAYCCEFGYQAVENYDPASGLGSINYSNMLQYILSINNIN